MGLRDLFRGKTDTNPTPNPLAATPSPPVPKSATGASWLPAGTSFDVAGRAVAGGMVYVGKGLRSIDQSGIEPALIDPSLPVDWNRPDWNGTTMGYWPSYHKITPQARAAYLSWLSAGRRTPGAYIGYVFLFFYGLERRILKDVTSTSDPDLVAIANEVTDLQAVYGDSHSFMSYSTEFVELVNTIILLGRDFEPPAWNPNTNSWQLPWSVRLGVGRIISENEPVPAEWALSYLLHHPESYLRTPATRCREEFDELFKARYRERFGAGLVVKPPKAQMTIDYRPASGGIDGTANVDAGVPDVASLTALLDPLKELGSECSDALDPYSRLLGRQPDAAGTAAAIGLLPKELLARQGGPVLDALRTYTDGLLSNDPHPVVLVDELLTRYQPGISGPLSKKDLVSLASLLAKLGVGIEPDPRFGSPTAKFGTNTVIFRLPDGAAAAPSRAYAAAVSLVHLTAAVAAADGSVSEAEQQHLVQHAESALGLDEAERARIEAHLHYLAQTKLTAAVLRKQVEALPVAERQRVGAFLISVAAADGVVTPAEITILVKLFAQLGLDEADVYRQVHAAGVDPGPVTIRDSESSERYAIPPPAPAAPAGVVQLDEEKVQQRIAETAHVSALLAGIFAADPASPFAPPSAGPAVHLPPPGAPPPPAAPPVPGSPPQSIEPGSLWGLDGSHSALARLLATRPSWSRGEAEDAAAEFGLPLLDGAIDKINEAALDACGDTLVDGDDDLEVNSFTVGEMG